MLVDRLRVRSKTPSGGGRAESSELEGLAKQPGGFVRCMSACIACSMFVCMCIVEILEILEILRDPRDQSA